MTAKTPTNQNFLSPNGFQLVVEKLPNVEWFVQEVDMPSITGSSVSVPSSFTPVKHQFDQVAFDDLSISLVHDEDMLCWEELYKWMFGISFPNDFGQHRNLKSGETLPPTGLYSDITLIVETNKHNPNIKFTFIDAFPTRLSGFALTTRNTEVPTVQFTVSFSYTQFTFNKVV